MLNLTFVNGNPPALNARNMNAIVESIDTMQTQLANPFTYKGVKATVASLPSSGNTINDTWYVTAEGCLYSWNGTSWGQSSLNESDYLAILQQIISDNSVFASALASLLDGRNLINYSSITPNLRIKSTDGEVVSATNQSISDYIPVVPGATVSCNLILESYDYGHAFYNSDKVFLSAVQGYDGLEMTVPDGAAYLRMTIQKTVVSSQSLIARMVTSAFSPSGGSDLSTLTSLLDGRNIVDYTTITASMRIRSTNGEIVSATNQDISDYIPVIPGTIIACNLILESYDYGHAFYDSHKNFLSAVQGYDALDMTVPDGAAYLRMTIQKTVVASQSLTARIVASAITPRGGFVVEKTNWLALGDSIVYGVYSTAPGTTFTGPGWANRLAKSLNYDLDNQGVRGMGYVAVGSNQISWSDVLDTVDTLTGPYNLITINLGINDYATNGVSLEAVQAALQTGIERISAKFPEARLVVFTPLNSCRQGSVSTNWAYGAAHHDGITLKNLADAITETCATNGVECINLSNGFLLNRYNIQTLLPDNTHPSNYCHTLIAKGMTSYLFG